MTELRQRWPAQAQLMKDEFLETLMSWAGVASLVGSCEEDSKSFIPVPDVRRFELADWSGKLHCANPVFSFLLLVLSVFLSFLQIVRIFFLL